MAADQDASQLATAFISVICPKLLHKLLHSKHSVSCHEGGRDDKPQQREAGCFGLLSKTQLGSHVVCCSTEYLGATTQSRAEQRAQHATVSVSVPRAVKVISAWPLGVLVCGQKLHCPYWLFKIITIVWLTEQ